MTMTSGDDDDDDEDEDEHEREHEHEHGSYDYNSDDDFIFSLVPTTVPKRFTIDYVTSTSSTLKWTPVPLDEVNGRLLGYNISVYDYLRKRNTYRLAPPNASSMELDELRPYTHYKLGIRAYTRIGAADKTLEFILQTYESGKLGAIC